MKAPLLQRASLEMGDFRDPGFWDGTKMSTYVWRVARLKNEIQDTP